MIEGYLHTYSVVSTVNQENQYYNELIINLQNMKTAYVYAINHFLGVSTGFFYVKYEIQKWI